MVDRSRFLCIWASCWKVFGSLFGHFGKKGRSGAIFVRVEILLKKGVTGTSMGDPGKGGGCPKETNWVLDPGSLGAGSWILDPSA